MRRAALAVILLAAATGLAGCRASKPTPPAPPPPRVTVIRPVSVPVRDYWTYNGYLEQTKTAEVRSKVRGYLTSRKFTEGTEVAAGTVLYTIDKLEFETAVNKAEGEEKQAEAEVIKAEAEVEKAAAQIKTWVAQIEQARADLAREIKLGEAGTGAVGALDLAKAAVAVRVAEHKAAEAAHKAALATHDATKGNHDAARAALHTTKIQLGYTDIRAKIGGRISRTLVDEGTLVQADTTHLTTILKVDDLYVYFDAPEGDLIAFRQSDPLSQHVPVEVGVTKEEGYPHVGRIDFRENKVEVSTGTVRLRGIIDNPPITVTDRPLLADPTRTVFKALVGVDPQVANNVRALFPGMYARVRVPKGEPTPQFVLPEDCLLSGQEGRFLYVVTHEGTVEKRVVTVGASVWKAPPTVPGVAPPMWAAVNPNPPPPAEGQPPPPTRRLIRSIVAIPAGLKEGERVILDGLQQVRPNAPVAPEEWTLTPPAEPKKP